MRRPHLSYENIANAAELLLEFYSDSPELAGLFHGVHGKFSSLFSSQPLAVISCLANLNPEDLEPDDQELLATIKEAKANWGQVAYMLIELVHGEKIELIVRNMDESFLYRELFPLQQLLDEYLIEGKSSELHKLIRDFNHFMRYSRNTKVYLTPQSEELKTVAAKELAFLEVQQGLALLEEDWDDLVIWGLLHGEIWA